LFQNKIYKVGITGNIGSGKSTVCRIFEALSIPIYYSDSEAKRLINTDTDIMSVYKRICGSDIYSDGLLDRRKAAEILFNDAELLYEVEQVVHPVVRCHFERWAAVQPAPFVLQESAVLFENGGNLFFDKIIFVSAPEPLRIQRVMKRDGWSEDAIRNRINRQWNEEDKISLSDFIIVCDDVQAIIPQVLKVHEQLLNIFEKQNSNFG
jgi:dephospho-CoA kinase